MKEAEAGSKLSSKSSSSSSSASAGGKQEKKTTNKGYAPLGTRLGVYWPVDKRSYSGEIVDIKYGLHCVQYDDGEVDWLNLDNESFVVEDCLK